MPEQSQLSSYAKLLQLTPVGDAAVMPQAERAEKVSPPKKRFSGAGSFFAFVVLPVCLATAYFGLLAAGRYESEAQFVLRTPGRNLMNGQMTSALVSTGVSRSDDDSYVVRDYLESRDAVDWLAKHSQLREAYASAGSDPIWRFPNLMSSDTNEGLYRHYRRMMSATTDSATGVSTLKIQAFKPADAQRLATSLLDAAEGLVNRLNERAREDTLAFAHREADNARRRVLAAQSQLTAFREREQLIDPGQAILAVMETIAKLSIEVAATSVQLNELAQSSPSAPQISGLRIRRAALEAQIATERRRLAGDAQAIAPRIAEYERLMLEREFAEKALIAALTAVETARVEAMRQQIYLERVASPSQPDYPTSPWRVVWSIVSLAAALMIWRIWRVLAADALRHAES